MMTKFLQAATLTALLSGTGICQAQTPPPNLITNPSFDAQLSAPRGRNNVEWGNAGYPADLSGWAATTRTTPDYWATNAAATTAGNLVNPATCPKGTYPPHWPSTTGGVNGALGLMLSTTKHQNVEYVEYVTQKLAAPLQAGKKYYAEFYALRLPGEGNGASKLGLNVTTADPKNRTDLKLYTAASAGINAGAALTGTTWQKVAGCFTAAGGEQYVNLGFMNPLEYTKVNSQTCAEIAYYAVDDVVIRRVLDATDVAVTGPAVLCGAQPFGLSMALPAGYTVTGWAASPAASFTQAAAGAGSSTFTTAPAAGATGSGTITATIATPCGSFTVSKTVQFPYLTVVGNSTICGQATYSLNTNIDLTGKTIGWNASPANLFTNSSNTGGLSTYTTGFNSNTGVNGGTGTITATVYGNCSIAAQKQVTVNALPQITGRYYCSGIPVDGRPIRFGDPVADIVPMDVIVTIRLSSSLPGTVYTNWSAADGPWIILSQSADGSELVVKNNQKGLPSYGGNFNVTASAGVCQTPLFFRLIGGTPLLKTPVNSSYLVATPNPAQEEIVIKRLDNSLVIREGNATSKNEAIEEEIYDVFLYAPTGQLVRKGSCKEQLSFDVKSLPSGIYHLRTTNKTQVNWQTIQIVH